MLSFPMLLLLACPCLMLRISGVGGSFPRPLSAKEEEECLKRLSEGDIEARNILIERNLRLVAHIAKKYYTQTGDQDDLISIGTIGLIKGISTYRTDKNVRLATYASRCIENEILMYFRGLRKTAGDISLSEGLESDTEGDRLSLMDVICVEDDMADNLGNREMCARISRYMSQCLTDREAEILTLRYGLNGQPEKPQREIAKRYGISRSYVSRIEKKALEKLRHRFEEPEK